MCQPNYKLMYFDARGLAEPIRLIFHYKRIPFEDVRLPRNGLTPEKKSELGLVYGQLPVLEISGKMYAQSRAIGRYLAGKYNLMPKDEYELLLVDEIVEAMTDYIKFCTQLIRTMDKEKRKEIEKKVIEVHTPIYFSRFNMILEKSRSGWFVGDQVSYADLFVGHFAGEPGRALNVDIRINDYPALEKLVNVVENLPGIKEWIVERPITLF